MGLGQRVCGLPDVWVHRVWEIRNVGSRGMGSRIAGSGCLGGVWNRGMCEA